jgi:hypothetical protein
MKTGGDESPPGGNVQADNVTMQRDFTTIHYMIY